MPSDKIGNVATCMTCVSRLDTEPKYVMKFVCTAEEMECNIICDHNKWYFPLSNFN